MVKTYIFHFVGFNDEITNQLEILKQKGTRIILGNFNETWARSIFCDAFKKRMYGSKFQWLIVGMYDEDWWEKDDNSTDCNPSEIKTALVGVMVMDIQALASREEITVSGRVSTKPQQHTYKGGPQIVHIWLAVSSI